LEWRQQLKELPEEKIFGLTGILTLNEDNIVNRSLMWAQFRDGKVSTIPMIFDHAL
jgi:outer membrane PBP1 activator LpoA protein